MVLCAVMLRGRHRGLPVAVDRAVLVPDERLGWAEEEDAVMRNRAASRSRSRTFGPGVGLERTGSIGVATPGSRTTRRDEVD